LSGELSGPRVALKADFACWDLSPFAYSGASTNSAGGAESASKMWVYIKMRNLTFENLINGMKEAYRDG